MISHFFGSWLFEKSQQGWHIYRKYAHNKYKAPKERYIFNDSYIVPLELFSLGEITLAINILLRWSNNLFGFSLRFLKP
jgi:hypothetical protein